MAEGKARCTACQVEFKAKKDGAPYAHKCVPAGPPPSRTCACGETTTMGPFPGRHEAEQCGESATGKWPVPDPFSSPTKPATRTCACGEVTTMGPFPGMHEAAECGTHVRLISTDGEDLTEAYSPQEPFTDDPFESPVTDHRKWCTRCKLLGHYSADCTTPVLDGGVVSVPVVPRLGDPAQHTSPYLAALAAEVGDVGTVIGPVPASGRCDGCMTVHAGECDEDAKPQHLYTDSTGVQWAHPGERDECGLPECQPEPDPFESPTVPAPEVNVSGQPKARYEWRGKVNWGYLVKLPETGDFRRYKNGKPKGLARVTTFNKAATDSNALSDWGKRNVLIGASKRPDLVAQAHGLTHEDNRDQLMKLVAELETTAGAKVSADVGTLIHELTERWDAGVITIDDVPQAYKELIRLYQDKLNQYGLRPVSGLIERTTYIPEFGGVVGTLDRVYYHEASGQYVIGDVKTGKTLEYGMDEIETQEWIYAHGVNNAGVYDWNTDTWDRPWEGAGIGPQWSPLTSVSEDWGVVIHMPVQGEDAGKVMLVRADLQRGKRHAQVCHDVRVQRANKPKPEPWTGEEFAEPVPQGEVAEWSYWERQFSDVSSRENAAAVWQRAYDRGVPPEEMEKLKEIADARLKGLEKPDWDHHFSQVGSVSGAGAMWEAARAAGVDPMELNRLVGLAQQRLRELGISG